MSDFLDATQSLELLKKGNLEYQNKDLKFHKLSSEERYKLNNNQHPLAIILTCSDSRVSPELIFNQSHGKLFVLRIAGNILDTASLGTIEFGLAGLNISLITIMGHSNCGMIQAVLNNNNLNKSTKAIKYITDFVKPALSDININYQKDGSVDLKTVKMAVKKNVNYTAKKLYSSSKLTKELVDNGKVNIVSAYYNIENGEVNFWE